jgi:hypothetical protein
MGRVADQHHAVKNRVRLINFHDLSGVRLPGLIKQLGDRIAEVVEVATPIAGRTTVSRRYIGIAVNRALPQCKGEQAAPGCQSSVPGIVLAVPVVGNEAPAPAAGGLKPLPTSGSPRRTWLHSLWYINAGIARQGSRRTRLVARLPDLQDGIADMVAAARQASSSAR